MVNRSTDPKYGFVGIGCVASAQMKGVEEAVIKALPPQKALTRKAPPAFFSERSVAKKASGKVNKSNIGATAFSVADLQAATNSFSEDNLIGEGGLGGVYRADFPNGQVLAVKNVDSKASMVQNEDDFWSVVLWEVWHVCNMQT